MPVDVLDECCHGGHRKRLVRGIESPRLSTASYSAISQLYGASGGAVKKDLVAGVAGEVVVVVWEAVIAGRILHRSDPLAISLLERRT